MKNVPCICPDNVPIKRRPPKAEKIKMENSEILSMWLTVFTDIVFRLVWFSITVLIVGTIMRIAYKFYKADFNRLEHSMLSDESRKPSRKGNLRSNWEGLLDLGPYLREDQVITTATEALTSIITYIEAHPKSDRDGNHHDTINKTGQRRAENLKFEHLFTFLGDKSTQAAALDLGPYLSQKVNVTPKSATYTWRSLLLQYSPDPLNSVHIKETEIEVTTVYHHTAKNEVISDQSSDDDTSDLTPGTNTTWKRHHDVNTEPKMPWRRSYLGMKNKTRIKLNAPSVATEPDFSQNTPEYHPQNEMYPDLIIPASAPTTGQPSQTLIEDDAIPRQNPQYPLQAVPGFLLTQDTSTLWFQSYTSRPNQMNQRGYQSQQGYPRKPGLVTMSYPGKAPSPTYIPKLPSVISLKTANSRYQSQRSQRGYPGKPGHLASMSHPGRAQPTYIPALSSIKPSRTVDTPAVNWIPSTPHDAHALTDKAVVAGYESSNGSPLWVIRTRFEGDLVPGKLAIKNQVAFIPWGGKENVVQNFEVCCARPDQIRWVESREGVVPPKAIPAGYTTAREPLYIGRAKHQGSLTPGKVHPSHRQLYIPFGGQEVPLKSFEVLCSV